MAAFVEAYDEAVKAPLADYLALSQKIGGDVQKHVGYCSIAGITPKILPNFYFQHSSSEISTMQSTADLQVNMTFNNV